MNSNAILTSDVLDILFENRNKKYGAYDLRKFYPTRIKTSLLIMLGFAAILSAFTLLPEEKRPVENPYKDGGMIVKEYEEPKEPEKPKEKPVDNTVKSSQKFLDKIEVVKNNEKTDTLNDITHLAISSATVIIQAPPATGDFFPPTVPGGGNVTVPAEPAFDPTVIDENPDVPPTYPGGNKELVRFLERNLLSPEEIGEEVQVKIKFVVDNDGNLESFDIVHDGGEAFNKEVIRVLKKMPQWNPGKKGGRSVKAYCYLPVKFQPNE